MVRAEPPRIQVTRREACTAARPFQLNLGVAPIAAAECSSHFNPGRIPSGDRETRTRLEIELERSAL